MGCGSVSVWERPAPAAAKGLAAQGVKRFASRLPQVLPSSRKQSLLAGGLAGGGAARRACAPYQKKALPGFAGEKAMIFGKQMTMLD